MPRRRSRAPCSAPIAPSAPRGWARAGGPRVALPDRAQRVHRASCVGRPAHPPSRSPVSRCSRPGRGRADRDHPGAGRLRHDLLALPDEQRAALVLRELSGFSHAQIARDPGPDAGGREADSSTRHGAGLHAMAHGRDARLQTVQRSISDGDGRVLRSRGIRAHVRTCASCRRFRGAIAERPASLAALAPVLPLVVGRRILSALRDLTCAGATGGGAGGVLAGGGASAGIAGVLAGLGSGLAAKVTVLTAGRGGRRSVVRRDVRRGPVTDARILGIPPSPAAAATPSAGAPPARLVVPVAVAAVGPVAPLAAPAAAVGVSVPPAGIPDDVAPADGSGGTAPQPGAGSPPAPPERSGGARQSAPVVAPVPGRAAPDRVPAQPAASEPGPSDHAGPPDHAGPRTTPARPITPARRPTPARPITPAPAPGPRTPARRPTPARPITPARRPTPARPITPARRPTPARPITPARRRSPARRTLPARRPARVVPPTRAPWGAAAPRRAAARRRPVAGAATAPRPARRAASPAGGRQWPPPSPRGPDSQTRGARPRSGPDLALYPAARRLNQLCGSGPVEGSTGGVDVPPIGHFERGGPPRGAAEWHGRDRTGGHRGRRFPGGEGRRRQRSAAEAPR